MTTVSTAPWEQRVSASSPKRLFPWITECTEDIAVEALGYILNKSPAAG